MPRALMFRSGLAADAATPLPTRCTPSADPVFPPRNARMTGPLGRLNLTPGSACLDTPGTVSEPHDESVGQIALDLKEPPAQPVRLAHGVLAEHGVVVDPRHAGLGRLEDAHRLLV